MRIAYYIWETFTAGGLQRITIDKANLLAEMGHSVLLITSNQAGRPAFWHISPSVELCDLGIDYQAANAIANPLRRIAKLRSIRAEHKQRLEKTLRHFGADICVNTVYCEEGSIFPELRDGSLKVLESHGTKYALLPKYERKGKLALLGKVQDYLRRRAYEAMPRQYDHFVVLSPSHLEQWPGYQNISAIPNMCTLPEGVRADLERKEIVTLARLSEEKNLSSLIRIFAKVAPLAPEWRLSIWGDGPLRSVLQSEIDALGLSDRILLRGETQDVASALSSASIFCLSSRHEGFPLALIEAQTAGMPIVCYDCPTGPRDIVHDASDGYLVPLGDEEAFAQKLLKLVQDLPLRRKFGVGGGNMAKSYQPKSIMTRWLKLFDELLSKR